MFGFVNIIFTVLSLTRDPGMTIYGTMVPLSLVYCAPVQCLAEFAAKRDGFDQFFILIVFYAFYAITKLASQYKCTDNSNI